MTSKLTREWLQKTISDIKTARDSGAVSWDGERENCLQAFELALAVIDSKPIGWTDKEELRDVDVAGIGYLFKLDAAPGFDPRRQILLIQAPEVNV
ncbi:hypothetical protein [Klebsiella michiganensis]|uniref:hypothetical protein n=1 Tax=Klebsiella michiganensis TaxID=1134687 RepID=UPI001CC9394F|nr:hypothetical protein [Klebsiella michiganensis]MBZ7629314.1 hypothetical protein [Klebsiella michiganensis]